jgi:hypothetical protein
MLTLCSEKSQYETVYLWIDDYRFEVSVDDYFLAYNDLVEEPSDEYADVCLIGIVDTFFSSYWVLGDAFMKGYYTIHDNDDHENARMGFAPHS